MSPQFVPDIRLFLNRSDPLSRAVSVNTALLTNRRPPGRVYGASGAARFNMEIQVYGDRQDWEVFLT